LSLPYEQEYSYNFNDTTTLYFNLCSGTDACNGQIACLVDENGRPTTYFGYTRNPYYYSSYRTMSMSYYSPTGLCQKDISFQFQCDTTVTSGVKVYYATYDNCDLSVQMYTSLVCNTLPRLTYQRPFAYSSLSGMIYMSGKISMFLLDEVSQADDSTEFIGWFYYSATFNSLKINGTLSNSLGQQSQVGYLNQGFEYFDNPPRVFSWVTLPGQSQHDCVLQAASSYDNLNWFSTSENQAFGGSRTYESIYFQKGQSFPVNIWSYTSYDVMTTVIQRVDNHLPVYISGDLLAPYVNDGNLFVSELDWDALSTTNLPKSTFDVPAAWNCIKK